MLAVTRRPVLHAFAALLAAAGCGDNSSHDPERDVGTGLCYAPIADTTCGDTSPAPSGEDDIRDYVRAAALPLECGDDGEEPIWDLDVFRDLARDQRMFMFGEVHGTNEIGVVSARIFEDLARDGQVNVVGMELPMDLEVAFQNYVATGSDETAQSIITFFDVNFFGRTLTDTARALAAEGIAMDFAAVDTPYGTDVAVARIAQIAETLEAHKDLVLDTLPEPLGFSDQMSPAYVEAAMAYHEMIEANLADICTELGDDDCDALINMSRAIWVAAASWTSAEDFDIDHWFAVREEVIYFNMREHLRDEDRRMFLHMGAFHTNKFSMSAGSRMAQEYQATRERVVSVAPAFGAGSQIWYGDVMDVPAMPEVISDALEDADDDPHYVSVTRPDATCTDTPLVNMLDDLNGTLMGETYDGYVHVRRLTPSSRPADATLRTRGAAFWRRFDRVRALERAAGVAPTP